MQLLLVNLAHAENDAQEIVALNSEIERIRGKRNKFSHSCWCRSSDEEIFALGLSGFVPPAKKLKNDSMLVSVRELEELYKQSYSVVDRLSVVVARIPAIAEERNLTSGNSYQIRSGFNETILQC